MKILVHSPAFLPRVGGLEVQTATLARGLVAAGDEVVVVTRTPATGADREPYEVARNPSPSELLRRTRWCQVVLHQNLSLRGLWPLLAVRRPLVVAHHSWYRRHGRVGWRERLKRAVVARASGSISVSRAIAADLGSPSTVVPNAYRPELFFENGAAPRDGDLIFVGRLVSDKGVDVLLGALARLAADGLRPGLTIVGEGPERGALESAARASGVREQVRYAGELAGAELAAAYRRHRVLVVPSRYAEPFGIVALEGIACGCRVVGSERGGLAEAIGPCGLTFPNGDAGALADRLRRVLAADRLRATSDAEREAHLERHRPERMVAGYREVLAAAAGAGRA